MDDGSNPRPTLSPRRDLLADWPVLVTTIRLHGSLCSVERLSCRLPQLSRLDDTHHYPKALHVLRSVHVVLKKY